MSSSSSNTSGGIGICGFLFLIFLTLKLAEIGTVATWSWWWVTAPLWGPIVLVLGIFLLALVVIGILALFGKKVIKRKVNKINFNFK